MIESQWLNLLQAMIDERGLIGVLEDMARICDDKSEMAESDPDAVRWQQAGAVLMAAGEHINV